MAKQPVRRRGRRPSAVVEIDRGEAPQAPVSAVEAALEAKTEAVPVRKRRRRGALEHGGAFKLHAPTREGYVRRFVNDKGNRLAELQEIGYTFVEEQGIDSHGPGTRVNRLAGTHEGGAPLKTYLMEIPVEFYREDMQDKDEALQEFDRAISEGRDPSGETDPSHSYRPGEARHSSISIER